MHGDRAPAEHAERAHRAVSNSTRSLSQQSKGSADGGASTRASASANLSAKARSEARPRQRSKRWKSTPMSPTAAATATGSESEANSCAAVDAGGDAGGGAGCHSIATCRALSVDDTCLSHDSCTLVRLEDTRLCCGRRRLRRRRRSLRWVSPRGSSCSARSICKLFIILDLNEEVSCHAWSARSSIFSHKRQHLSQARRQRHSSTSSQERSRTHSSCRRRGFWRE